MLLPSLSYLLWSLGAHPFDAIITPILLVVVQIVGFRAAPIVAAMLDHMRKSTFCAECGELYDINSMPTTCPSCASDLRSRRAIYYYSSPERGSPMTLLGIRSASWGMRNINVLIWVAFVSAAFWIGWMDFFKFLDFAGYGIPMPL